MNEYVGKCFKTIDNVSYSTGGINKDQIIIIVGFGSKFIFGEETEGIYFLSKNEVCFYYFNRSWTLELFLEGLEEL